MSVLALLWKLKLVYLFYFLLFSNSDPGWSQPDFLNPPILKELYPEVIEGDLGHFVSSTKWKIKFCNSNKPITNNYYLVSLCSMMTWSAFSTEVQRMREVRWRRWGGGWGGVSPENKKFQGSQSSDNNLKGSRYNKVWEPLD